MSGGRFLAAHADINWATAWDDVSHPKDGLRSAEPWSDLAFFVYNATGLLVPVLLTWTLLVLVCRLRSPRPSARRLWRQPGFLACIAVQLSFTWQGADYMAIHGVRNLLREHESGATITNMAVWLANDFHTHALERLDAGWAVAASWLFMGASRRLRAEPGWIDRMGRIIGVAWILATISVRVCWFLFLSES